MPNGPDLGQIGPDATQNGAGTRGDGAGPAQTRAAARARRGSNLAVDLAIYGPRSSSSSRRSADEPDEGEGEGGAGAHQRPRWARGRVEIDGGGDGELEGAFSSRMQRRNPWRRRRRASRVEDERGGHGHLEEKRRAGGVRSRRGALEGPKMAEGGGKERR